MSTWVINDDMLIALPKMIENSIHCCVTDPPYELGFMGKKWDSTGIAFRPETWAEVYRVLRPGAYLLAFGAPRNAHRMTCAIEDAGFEIRDTIMWLFGSGFPKSHDVSKALDRKAGAEREVVDRVRIKGGGTEHINRSNAAVHEYRPDGYQKGENILDVTAPATEEAKRWQGWGSALKPAHEPIIVARKPLDGTIADNVLKWGVGGINVDGCRIEGTGNRKHNRAPGNRSREQYRTGTTVGPAIPVDYGRWPANVAHDGSEEVIAAFPDSDGQSGAVKGTEPSPTGGNGIFGHYNRVPIGGAREPRVETDKSAARFFYCGKARASDRVGSKHPTVKPIALMRWLVTMVTPPDGTVLDPFAGTGSTLLAAAQLGFHAIGIEADPTYAEDARRKIEGLGQ